LINESKISSVNIEIRPFFIKKISNYFNNIEFKIIN
jgi:Fe-S cluster biosynthesis and repair protein YggX